ncbi:MULTISPECIES: penicillin acylase family protein [Salinibaculum]|uniref:penicillin acylase family protein n=1 Tax=Salinibaculum TaxID=2732368 RepID=UPI0030D628A7
MASRWTRVTGVVCVLALAAVFVFGGQFVGLTAPFSGSAWDAVDQPDGITVENPYGEATVTYDDRGVPTIEAENERALAYATGYVQARDRLFQMDLTRRLMGGRLAAAFGEQAVESDRFHRRMGFEDAAEATWRRLNGTEHGEKLSAYSSGVNHYVETRPLPLEFELNGYEPARWTPVDTLLVGQQISWGLSGSFADLRREAIAQELPRALSLYPAALDHDEAIIRGDRPGHDWEPPADSNASVQAVYESVREFDTEAGLGSNNWVVSGEYTASGEPILANDPHLTLTAPPVWYEMRLESPEANVSGAGFAGIPFVIIGANDDVAWGVTNVGADVTDAYSYEWRDGQYRYEGEYRDPETHTETIEVADGEDTNVTVRRTVHGPLLERENQTVAVAWTGLTATTQSRAIDDISSAENLTAFEDGLREFDLPAQNFVAIGRDGGTLYYPAGKYPIRTVDGEVVPGDRVFNGSAGHGEWRGFEPYGRSNWSGFVDFEDIPHLEDPGYVSTANQRVVDDPGFYLGTSMTFASPYRGMRINDLLAERVENGSVTREDIVAIQRDTHSAAAEQFVPQILNATDEMSPESRELARDLDEWDYEMDRDSRGALVFSLWLDRYRNQTFADEYNANNLDDSYHPRYWVLQNLPADSRWFDDVTTPGVEDRADIAARTMQRVREEIDREGYETYGDYNVVDVDHPFPVGFLDYPERPTDGSPFTVRNFRAGGSPVGSSYRFVVADAGSIAVLPGGNSGNYFSGHYADQFDLWRNGEYRPFPTGTEGDPTITFEEGDS